MELIEITHAMLNICCTDSIRFDRSIKPNMPALCCAVPSFLFFSFRGCTTPTVYLKKHAINACAFVPDFYLSNLIIMI